MGTKRDKVIVDVTIDENASINSFEGSNDPKAAEEFRDQAVGMFVHWGLDSWQTSVISHWIVGAEKSLVKKFYKETPNCFAPLSFRPEKIARLARQAGMRYGVFTTKHHSGFCMFDTKSTDMNCMHTPYGKDVTKMMCDAFRQYGIKAGLYFSPLDFYWCSENGKQIHFRTPEVLPENNPGLMEYNKQQISELMTNYGDIYCMFFDGPSNGLRRVVWEKQPDCLVTRGEMKTPEQNMPDEEIDGPWEACFTLGDGWSYKATNEHYKTGTEIIHMLIEVRARGGNLLLNVTPDCDGEIPFEQVRILQELGLFLFFNGEAVYQVRPWKIPREGDVWFTKAKDRDTVYAFVTGRLWKYGFEGREWLTIQSVRATENTEIEMVGQSGDALEHKPEEDTQTRWYQDDLGLHINAMRCYRPYDNRQWPNPVVFRITHAEYKEI